MTRPQTDEYPGQLEDVIAALVAGDMDAARRALRPIAYEPRVVPVRSDPSETVITSVYKRDRFRCRYCGCRVIPTQIMRLVSHHFSEAFPYRSDQKAGHSHPAIASRSATHDHVLPWSTGGTNDPENLVCACPLCNQIKGDFTLKQLGWKLLPISDDDSWDGLTRFYPKLWELAGRPTLGDHALWLRRYA